MAGVNTGETLLPFYIVCDESGSMGPNGGVDAINQGLPDLHATIAADPLVSDKCRIGLITFSDTAEELMSLGSSFQTLAACDFARYCEPQVTGLHRVSTSCIFHNRW